MNRKVFYLSYHREPTGWGQAARNHIMALIDAGFDVACRNITLTRDIEVDERIVECERKDGYDADICIQHVLPHHLTGTDNFEKNIAVLEYETTDIRANHWFNHLKLVDQVWVPNGILAQQLDPYFDVKLIPHSCDTSRYYQEYQTMSIRNVDHTFKFYTICDLNQRKNIESLIKCFHKEFDRTEDVSLIIKVKDSNQGNIVNSICKGIKKILRIYNNEEDYHTEIVIDQYMTDEEIMVLHKYGDCFVNLSYGESWSIPTFDAMAMGNHPIVTNHTGMCEYIWDTDEDNKGLGWRIPSYHKICDSIDSPFPELFSGREYWMQVDERMVCHAMRQYYDNKHIKTDIAPCLERANLYSHHNVGKVMKEALI